MLEGILNHRLSVLGRAPAKFVLADLYPDWKAWARITQQSKQISFIDRPVDATVVGRYVEANTPECRLYSLCFHHFDDATASKVLRRSIEGSEAFV